MKLSGLLLGCLGAWVRVAAAQCPDGSPPPCTRAAARPTPAANSVAVLCFDNLSRDTADAYLADGLTEEVIVRLGQVRRIGVRSRYESQNGGDRPYLATPTNRAPVNLPSAPVSGA